MRAVFIALVAVLLCAVAISVDAYSYRVYRGTATCQSGVGVSSTTYYAFLNSCIRTNSTTSSNYNQFIYSKLTKCNSTSNIWESAYYGTSVDCTGSPILSSGAVAQCISYNSNPPSSYYIECSAGSLAFGALLVIAAIVTLMF